MKNIFEEDKSKPLEISSDLQSILLNSKKNLNQAPQHLFSMMLIVRFQCQELKPLMKHTKDKLLLFQVMNLRLGNFRNYGDSDNKSKTSIHISNLNPEVTEEMLFEIKMFLKPVWEGEMHGVTKIGLFCPLFCVNMLGKSTNYSTGTRPL